MRLHRRTSLLRALLLTVSCLIAEWAFPLFPEMKGKFCLSPSSALAISTVGYVPDGMTKEQYQKMLQKEKEASKGKNLGAYGPQSFQSRSLQAFQKDLEEGKAGHLMPVLNAQKLLKAGKIKQEDIPYMQVSSIKVVTHFNILRRSQPNRCIHICFS